MFGLFKNNPEEKLKKQYEKKLEQARDLQRNGDIKGFAKVTAEAEEIMKQIEALRQKD